MTERPFNIHEECNKVVKKYLVKRVGVVADSLKKTSNHETTKQFYHDITDINQYLGFLLRRNCEE